METVFDIGREMDAFDTDDEMLEKIRYYLNNEEARRRALPGRGSKGF